MINWKEFKSTGVQSVDMCATTIYVHRQKYIPLKAIHLMPKLYGQFKLWLEKAMGRELQDGEGLEFDGVNIEVGNAYQRTPMLIELWQN